jgi:uncharacterized protein YrrD
MEDATVLRSLKDLEGFNINASDGEIGRVRDFYFDDGRWVIRYLVANTQGFWQAAKEVLISPRSFGKPDWLSRTFHLTLTVEKAQHSPSIDAAKPVSRQLEQDHALYYGWPGWWNEAPVRTGEPDYGDPHLRSVMEVTGYQILAMDEAIGHVDDFIVDDESWTIRYLVVNTGIWWEGKKVLLAPLWVNQISWAESRVSVSLPKQAIRNSPEWQPEQPVNREYESRLYDYYGRPAYWVDGEK